MDKCKAFGKLTAATVAGVLTFSLASCSDADDDHFQGAETDHPNTYTVTVISIDMVDKDTGQSIDVGGEVISGSVIIRPGR